MLNDDKYLKDLDKQIKFLNIIDKVKLDTKQSSVITIIINKYEIKK